MPRGQPGPGLSPARERSTLRLVWYDGVSSSMLPVLHMPVREKETDCRGNRHLLLSIKGRMRALSLNRLKAAFYSCMGQNGRPYKSVRKYNLKGINKNYCDTTSSALYRLQHSITDGMGTYKGRGSH